MKKVFSKLHLWLAVPFGLLISIICFTGAALVFETEIQELCYPSRYFVEEVKESPIPLRNLMVQVSKQLPDSVSVSGVTVPMEGNRNYRVSISGQGRRTLFVDPYTAEIRGEYNPYEKGTFFSVMRRTHRFLMDDYKRGSFSWGKTLVGVSTLVFVFILIAGIIIWIPKSVRGIKKRLRMRFNNGWRRFWYDLHISAGMYAAIVLLLLALTGLTWSFDWYRNGFYKLFGVDMTQSAPSPQATPTATASSSDDNTSRRETRREEGRPHRGQSPDSIATDTTQFSAHRQEGQERGRGSENQERGERTGGKGNRGGKTNYAVWENVLEDISTRYASFKSISMQDGSVSVSAASMGNTRGSDRYTFDSRTGEITEVKLYKDNEKSGKIRGWIYSVHVGSWGGMFTRIITFLASLIGGTLPLTGYYMWIRKTRKKKNKQKLKQQAV